MSAQLEQLLILQDRDIKLKRADLELANIPHEAKAIENKLKTQLTDYESHKNTAKQIEAERKDLDNQVQAKKTAIAKYKNQQFETRKNDEFQALNNEIARAEKDIVDLEDKELELMEQYDKAQKDLAAESVKVKEFEAAAQGRKSDLDKKKGVLEGQKKGLEAEISELSSKVEAGELSLYRRLLQSKGDIAIVPVEHGNTCGGCHMTLTHQTCLLAKAGQKIVHCENCGRILYWIP